MCVFAVAPFAGAWIEIKYHLRYTNVLYVAPFAGAWIEILDTCKGIVEANVAPFAGAWIEIDKINQDHKYHPSHPLRVRGLKSFVIRRYALVFSRTLCGCVD